MIVAFAALSQFGDRTYFEYPGSVDFDADGHVFNRAALVYRIAI